MTAVVFHRVNGCAAFMSPITTHVLDTTAGRPLSGVSVLLEDQDGSGHWQSIARGRTDSDGRVRNLLPDAHVLHPGLYRLRFDTSERSAFFPEVVVCFRIESPNQHFHVPLLFNPYGYTTYRGS
jgi:5-hydroxyisourate hydrolase